MGDPGFNEINRVGEPWEGNYRELRRLYVEGAAHSGWERKTEAIERFEALWPSRSADRPTMTQWCSATFVR